MDRQERIDFILEHYESPRHYGPTDPADMVMQGGNPGCGDIITVYLKADENDAIAGLSFEGAGCTISQAATSMVMEMFESKTLTDIENTAQDTIIDLLGREIAATRLRCATLGLTTVQNAVRELRRQRLAREYGVILPETRSQGFVAMSEVTG
ncbi:MAG: iron-sulfur cluster assembly scaffold protein [Anaerolineae bacterium]|uniref:iron-sulfur cluster assembly scaffold protein n=1 Tax=Candidatus Amarolinea dominans TaxID=3140696 RepID=UPI001D537148|nr:iron-sulfur cluster assembly scaffold protein [Anaerolineae bacterium]MBK7202742.1 iron-sulfur cluster assembly scaffold protein [Anaerolineae bacterium]MBK9092029.1 iron-sulfur cluster assembly scaffold protein [Anaerolineae bacterium]MBK9232210.1 iron-sulfur cluster assembly scaffold protein [Anaerolineae bacterium]